MNLSCVIFDCDGVILESMDAKNAAQAKICEEIAPEHVEAFAAYTAEHGGVSRFEKFAWLIRRAFNRDITPEESTRMGEKFTQYCLDAVLAAPLVPGFLETVQQWHGRTPMFVASGTPHYELVEILQKRGLDHYFAGICGTPPGKAALLTSIVREVGAPPATMVMVGDSKTDLDAAVIAGTRFYGRGSLFQNTPWPWGEDLFTLNKYLENIAAGTL